ncbi:unnamed protein product [Ectocarpus sp. 8 AP-2014]
MLCQILRNLRIHATGDWRPFGRPGRQSRIRSIVFFVFCSAGFPFKTAVVNSRDSLAGATHTQQCFRGTTHAYNTSGAREIKQEAAIQRVAPPVPAGLCATESVTSNQGVCIGVGDPDPATRLCVCAH